MIIIDELKKLREKNKLKIKTVLSKDTRLKNKDRIISKIKELKKDYYFTRNKLKKSHMILSIDNIVVDELVSSDKYTFILKLSFIFNCYNIFAK